MPIRGDFASLAGAPLRTKSARIGYRGTKVVVMMR